MACRPRRTRKPCRRSTVNFAHYRVNESGFVPLGVSARSRLSLRARVFHQPRATYRYVVL
jgi:hypothetical protein